MDTETLEQRIERLEQSLGSLKGDFGGLWVLALVCWLTALVFSQRTAFFMIGAQLTAMCLNRLVRRLKGR